MNFRDLLRSDNTAAFAYVLARYAYRIGAPILTDDEYDQLEIRMRKNPTNGVEEFLDRSYDDDPIPDRALLQRFGLDVVDTVDDRDGLYQYLEEEKSRSIKAIRSTKEAYEFFNNNRGRRIMVSLKLDGVNKKMLYKDGDFILSLSRGRKGNSIDYTQGSKYVVPKRITEDRIIKITGECFVEKAALEGLREKYDKAKYKTSKSSAISLLRVEHTPEDYKDLRVKAFSCEGLHFNTVSEMYEFLETVGFETPPHFTVDEFPADYGEFEVWLGKNILTRMAELGDGYPSDGVVVEVDDLTLVFDERNQYSDRQIALKFGPWGFECLMGTIVDIKMEQKRVHKSVRIKIDPIVSGDGCSAEYINSFNPAILIENDLRVGKTVYFERNSGAVNILIHGKRLEGILEGEHELV